MKHQNSTPTHIHEATSIEHIRPCFQIVRELRPHVPDEASFINQVQRQMAVGYKLAYYQQGEKVHAVVGYRFLEFLAWGKVCYIDDLITDSTTRRQGYGSTLLQWVIAQAKNAYCDQVHLDSGPQRHDAHRLYLNHGFKIVGHHFALELQNCSL